jgi:hypothetical protein
MRPIFRIAIVAALCWTATHVGAQQAQSPPTPASGVPASPAATKPAKGTPQSEAGEPRANTSAAPSAQSEAGEPRANTSKPAAAPGKPAPAASAAGQKVPGASDRLELGTATVTGDREQPKVMYIVPWKRSDIGDSGPG